MHLALDPHEQGVSGWDAAVRKVLGFDGMNNHMRAHSRILSNDWAS